MRLTTFTDYALRLLIYTASKGGERVTIDEVSDWFGISRAHVKKVVLTLSRTGFVTSSKGRHGGFVLGRSADTINLADLVMVTEPDFGLFECYLSGNDCRLSRPCRLPTVANEALDAFLGVLAKYTLADAMVRPKYFLEPRPEGPQILRGPMPHEARISGARISGAQMPGALPRADLAADAPPKTPANGG